MSDPIDIEAVLRMVDLRQMVEADRGAPDSSRKYSCPFHDDHSPSMGLSPDGRRFRCWSNSCGAKGDAIDYVMLSNPGMTFIEAVRKLDPFATDDRPGPKRERPAPPPRPVAPRVLYWPDPIWQAEVNRLVEQAEARLWSPEGAESLAWLRARGLEDWTIRAFRLGYLERDEFSARPIPILATPERPKGRKICARRGILIPWPAPGSDYFADPDDPEASAPQWCGANVRRLADNPFDPLPDEPKTQMLGGSEPGNGYPHSYLPPTQAGVPALICEGEFDAMIGHQQAGHLVNVLTVGGSKHEPKASAARFLEACPLWLLAPDHDEAGEQAAEAWIDRGQGKARPMILPHSKDLNDFHRAGGDVAGWIRAKLARLDALRVS